MTSPKGATMPSARRWILVVLLLAATACGGVTANDQPPGINYGRDICIECGMIIDDPRFAAAYRLPDGTEKKFDDLGDLVIHGREDDGFASARVWVSDFDDEVLVEAASAWYVPTLGVTSPMGHGLVAFSDRARAEAFATAIEGEVIDWDTVVGLPVTGGRVGHHHDGSMTQGGHGHGR